MTVREQTQQQEAQYLSARALSLIHIQMCIRDRIYTLYAHMSQLAVSYGDYVQQGQIIGYVGQTGNAYGNHCHFEIIINGRFMDPSKYIGTYYPGR